MERSPAVAHAHIHILYGWITLRKAISPVPCLQHPEQIVTLVFLKLSRNIALTAFIRKGYCPSPNQTFNSMRFHAADI